MARFCELFGRADQRQLEMNPQFNLTPIKGLSAEKPTGAEIAK
jgi:hypothetical protein